MNNTDYLALAEKELQGILALIKQKNADYTGGSDDALANFKLCQDVGLADAEIGILIRMMDKVQRIKSFLAKGSLEVKTETAQDAVRDIIGYSVALLGMLEDRLRQPSATTTVNVENGNGSATIIEAKTYDNWLQTQAKYAGLSSDPQFSLRDVFKAPTGNYEGC